MTYNPQSKSNRLVRGYGTLSFNSEGKIILMEESAAGSGRSVKGRMILGESRFHAIEKVTYDQSDIPNQFWNLYTESGDVNEAATIFPTYQLNPGASIIDFNLPPEMAQDGQLNKIVVKAECLEIADYNALGNQIDFGFSADAGRVCADGLIYLSGDEDILEWQSWYEWAQWTRGLITITRDGQQIQVPRFPLNIGLIPPYDWGHFLDRVCQLTCSDWVEVRGGKIRMISPEDRPLSFDLNTSRSKKGFRFQPLNDDDLYNGVIVVWRDINSPLLTQGKPVIFDRRADPTTEPENFFQINAGACRQDVAERLGSFWARRKCDMPDYAFIRGTRKTYPILPADVGAVSNPGLGWVNERCRVVRKLEKEGRENPRGIERFKGYGILIQKEPQPPYSDTDFTPLVTRQPVAGLNPFAEPPTPALEVSINAVDVADGSLANVAEGLVTFGNFGFPQTANIMWKKPGGTWKFYRSITPDSNVATFSASPLAAGTHQFRAVAVSQYGKQSAPAEDSIDIEAGLFYLNGLAITVAAYRALSVITPENRIKGRDTTIVDRTAIRAVIETAEVIGEKVLVVLAISIIELGNDSGGNRIHNHADSATLVQVDIINQFGETVRSLAATTMNQKAASVTAAFSRKYADIEQCYFRIRVLNYTNNYSLPVFLFQNYLNLSAPQHKLRVNCPLELTAAPLNQGLRFSFQFGGQVALFRKALNQTAWAYVTSGYSPIDYPNIPANDEADYQVTNPNNGNFSSNYVRAKTLPQAAPQPVYAPPLGVSLALDPQFPSTIVKISVSLGVSNQPTNLYNHGNYIGQLPAGQTEYSFSGRSAGENVAITARHDYGSGNLSEPCATQTTSTYNPPPSVQTPRITDGSYDINSNQVIVSFDLRGGTGQLTVDYNPGSGWIRLYTNSVPASAGYFTHAVARSSSLKVFQYRMEHSAELSWGNTYPVEIPAEDIYQPPPNYPGNPDYPIQQ